MEHSDKDWLERLAEIQRQTQGESGETLAAAFLEEFGKDRSDREPEYISKMRNYYIHVMGEEGSSGNIDHSFMERLRKNGK